MPSSNNDTNFASATAASSSSNDSGGSGLPILREVNNVHVVGMYTGQVKWFGGNRGNALSSYPSYGRANTNGNSSYNYGFITVCSGDLKGRDVFVHHTGVKPLSSRFRCLSKAEYVQFDIITNEDGQMQAVNVTGINGGPLVCDIIQQRRNGGGGAGGMMDAS